MENEQSEWIIFSGEKQAVEGGRGVQFETFEFNHSDPKLRDGARIEIEPGGRTPVQLVTEDIVIRDIPISGSLMFFHINTEGDLYYYTLSPDRGKKPIWFEIRKGEALCWYAHKTQEEPAVILEWESPGFYAFENGCTRNVDENSIPEEHRTAYEELFSILGFIDSRVQKVDKQIKH